MLLNILNASPLKIVENLTSWQENDKQTNKQAEISAILSNLKLIKFPNKEIKEEYNTIQLGQFEFFIWIKVNSDLKLIKNYNHIRCVKEGQIIFKNTSIPKISGYLPILNNWP